MILLCIILIVIEVLVLVGNRCMSSILLVHTTCVDIDQTFIVSDVSTPQSDAQYDTCKLCKYTFKKYLFVFLPLVQFQSFHVMPRPKF